MVHFVLGIFVSLVVPRRLSLHGESNAPLVRPCSLSAAVDSRGQPLNPGAHIAFVSGNLQLKISLQPLKRFRPGTLGDLL